MQLELDYVRDKVSHDVIAQPAAVAAAPLQVSLQTNLRNQPPAAPPLPKSSSPHQLVSLRVFQKSFLSTFMNQFDVIIMSS